MKKIILSLSLFGMLGILACSKNDKTSNTPTTKPSGGGGSESLFSWTLGAQPYDVVAATFTSSGLICSDGARNSCVIQFSVDGVPEAGKYKVVSYAAGFTAGSKELSILCSRYEADGTMTYYAPSMSNLVYASVNVSASGKLIQVSVPTVSMINTIKLSDSTTLSANIKQTN